MSDHIPRPLDETDRYLFNEQDLYRQRGGQAPLSTQDDDSFFKSYDEYGTRYNIPPSPILPPLYGLETEQPTYKLTDQDNPSAMKQVGVVNPSRPSVTNGVKDDQILLDNSRSNILSIMSLLNEHVVSHPFIVVRRQAQVNYRSIAYHLTPFTVIPLMLRLQSQQGFSTFFKGLPSVLVNYVLLIGSESFFYNLLQFPIEYDFGSIENLFSLRLLKHLALKSLSILVVTPFICSSSVETVQSWIVGESPYVLEHIKEGIVRIFHYRKDRKLAFYRLIGPSIAYHISYYVLYSFIRQVILQFYYNENDLKTKKVKHEPAIIQPVPPPQQQQMVQPQYFEDEALYPQLSTVAPTGITTQQSIVASTKPQPDNLSSQTQLMNELKSSLYAHLLTDIITYPFQNVLYRLFLQGTRTLIDNVDGRTAVIPLITNYDSAADCYQTIIQTEGTSGLFKGFGALILQYSVQVTIIHLTNYCIDCILNQ